MDTNELDQPIILDGPADPLTSVEKSVESHYDQIGWQVGPTGLARDTLLWEDQRAVSDWYQSKCRRRIADYVYKPASSLLNAGSGPLHHPEYRSLHADFARSVCVDLSEFALCQIRKIDDRIAVVKSSIRSLPFLTDSFDTVICFNVLNHLPGDHQVSAVEEVLRVTRPGGQSLFLYYNPRRLLLRRAGYRSNKSFSDEHQVSRRQLFHFTHQIDWWRQFSQHASVRFRPARALFVTDLKRFVPDQWVGRLILRAVYLAERLFPERAIRWGAYYAVDMRKL